MEAKRLCSRPGCQEAAAATLTFVYADSTAVLGPLATFPEPHCYDLCLRHATKLTVPYGWELIRGKLPEYREPEDELNALVDAVRETKSTVNAQHRELRGTRFDSRVRLAVLSEKSESDND